MAEQKFIKKAIKRPGRVRRAAGRLGFSVKEGKPLSKTAVDAVAANAKKKGNKSLLRAANLAKTLRKL